MKKVMLPLLIAILLITSFSAFSPAPQDDEFVIGIITGTVSQGEEEFRAAEKMAKLYPGQIITATYPDN